MYQGIKGIMKLVKQQQVYEEDSENQLYEVLGGHILRCMVTNITLFQISWPKNNNIQSQIPDFSDLIVDSADGRVSKKHLFIFLGKKYRTKDIQTINYVQVQIRRLLQAKIKSIQLNQIQNSYAQTSSSVNIKSHKNLRSFNSNQTILNQQNQPQQSFLSNMISSLNPFKKQSISQVNKQRKSNILTTGPTQYYEVQKGSHNNVSVFSVLNRLDNTQSLDLLNVSNVLSLNEQEVEDYLNGIESFATEMNQVSQFKYKQSNMEEEKYQETQNKEWICRSAFKIKHYESSNHPKVFYGEGRAVQKKKARELCYRQILLQLYTQNKPVFRECVDRKQKKGIKC